MRQRSLALSLATVLSSVFAVTLAVSPAAAAAVAPATGTAPHAAPAIDPRTSANDFTIDSFDAVYDLGRDARHNATLATTETIVADFPQSNQNHGIERALPTRDRGTDLRLHVLSVTDGAGHALPYSTGDDDDDEDGGDYRVLRIGDAHRYVHGPQTYVIRYTSLYVVDRYADTHDAEFYWDVNGTGWAQSMGTVSATVHLRDGIASDLNDAMSCYAGSSGSCSIKRSGDTVTAHDENVGAYRSTTIAIGFRYDAFAQRPLISDGGFYAITPWVLLGLLVAGAVPVLVLRLGAWRDARGRGIIVPEYSAPAGLYPALAAELLRERQRALSAQLVHFAVNGVVRIREYPEAKKTNRYELTLADPSAIPLQPDETALIHALFGGKAQPGATVRLDRSDRKLGSRLVERAGDALKTARSQDLMARPKSGRSRWLTIGLIVLAIAALVHVVIAAANDGDTAWTWLVDLVVAAGAITFCVLSVPRLRLTDAGAALRDDLRGLREYISLAEADRIRVLQEPSSAERIDVTDHSAVIKLYEKLLPYAMVWGIEKEWIRELERGYGTDATPDWYAGSGSLIGLASMSSTITTGSSASGATWSGSSGSSSYGGSGGGGFSGGGGGGGGGGGW